MRPNESSSDRLRGAIITYNSVSSVPERSPSKFPLTRLLQERT